MSEITVRNASSKAVKTAAGLIRPGKTADVESTDPLVVAALASSKLVALPAPSPAGTPVVLGADGKVPAAVLPPVVSASLGVVPKTASFTVASSDAGSRYNVAAASAVVVTIPANAADPVPIGSAYEVARRGTGPVSFAPAGGVTVNSYGGYTTIARQWSVASLVKVAADEWDLVGDLA